MIRVKSTYRRLFLLLAGGGVALSLIFLSLAGWGKQKTVSSSDPASNKSSRKTASSPPLSKQDVLGVDYDRDLDPRAIQKALKVHLNSFSELCSTGLSLRQKASLLDRKIKTLHTFLNRQISQPYLSVEMQVLLRDIRSILERVTEGRGVLTEDYIKDHNLSEDFVRGYYVSYNLPQEETDHSLPTWAKQIATGLHCLYPPVERRPSTSKTSASKNRKEKTL